MNWIERQKKDFFVKQRNKLNIVSRSYFKIKEINEKFRIINKNMKVLDLGCSPGGWTQYLLEKKCIITGVDLIPIKVNNINFIQQDIKDFETSDIFDLIVSDISPNISGNKTIDYNNMNYIVNIYWDLLKKSLINNGIFIFKSWTNIKPLLNWENIIFFKPKSSRKESKEIYIICKGFRKDN